MCLVVGAFLCYSIHEAYNLLVEFGLALVSAMLECVRSSVRHLQMMCVMFFIL